jgi:transposase
MHQTATPGNNIRAATLAAMRILRPKRHLGERQKAAIELLLQGLADQDVAAQLGVDRSTIFRWRRLPLFARELDAQRQLRRERAANQLQSMVPSALKILQQQLDSKDDRVRMRAVSILLRFATPGRLAPSAIVAAAPTANPANVQNRQPLDDLRAFIEAPLPGQPGAPKGMTDDADDEDDEDDAMG